MVEKANPFAIALPDQTQKTADDENDDDDENGLGMTLNRFAHSLIRIL
jgi:hypothetical protein